MQGWITVCSISDKTMMIFGDAKKMVEEMVRGINGGGH